MLFWFGLKGSSPNLKLISEDHAVFAPQPSPAEAARVRHLLTTTQYTLASLDFRQFTDLNERDTLISEFYRITLILSTLTILNERAPSTAVGQTVCNKFRHVLTKLISGSSHSSLASDRATGLLPFPLDFVLWAIFLASSVLLASESETKYWLLKSFGELAQRNPGNFESCHALRDRLSRYLWISSIHDSDLQLLWSKTGELGGECGRKNG